MNFLKDERLGRKYTALLVCLSVAFVAWVISNVVHFGQLDRIIDGIVKLYGIFAGTNVVTKVPQFVKDIQKVQAERRKNNGLGKDSQVDQTGTAGSGRDSRNGSTGEGDESYPEGGPRECEP